MSLRRRAGRARRAAVVGLAAVALAAAGCSGSAGGGSGSADTLIAYTGQAGDYQYNFNPYAPALIGGPGTIFEPLFYFNVARKQAPVPMLGTAYSWNKDGTRLTITTRQGVKWSDGTPFSAADVAFTLNMVAGHKTLNTTDYQGKATATDADHVVVTFPAPSFMDGAQVLGKMYVVPQHLWKNISDPATDTVKHPVGTGPYTLTDFKPQAFTLTANPTYWGGAPKVKKVRYIALSGNQSSADALKAGQIDWQTGPVPDIQHVASSYPGYQSITVPMNQAALFTCSNAALGCKGPQTDLAVRKAIYYGINRDQLNALAFDGTASAISPGAALPGRDAAIVSKRLGERTAPMKPDAARARALLESAGYTKGPDGIYAKNGRKLSLTVKVVSGWTDYITAVTTMAQQLKQVGIQLSAEQVSWNEWADARGQGQFQLLIDSLLPGPAPDPFYTYEYFFDSANTGPVGQSVYMNYARFKDPTVDAALKALKGIDPSDTAARQAQYDTIQTEIEKSLPYIPVLTGGTTSEFNVRKFSGWPSRSDLYAFPAVWSRPDDSQIFLHLKPTGK